MSLLDSVGSEFYPSLKMKRVAEDDLDDYSEKRVRYEGEFHQSARMKRVADNVLEAGPYPDKRVRHEGEFHAAAVKKVQQPPTLVEMRGPQPNYAQFLAQRCFGHCGINEFAFDIRCVY